MPYATRIVCFVGTVFLLAETGASAQSRGAWDVVVNGRSLHVNAAREWNEDNWGLGFEREFV
jgi:hypothetical protein